MPLVKVKSDVTHRVGADELLKAGDVFDASPAEVESFGDKFILVEDADPVEVDAVPTAPASVDVDATPSAHELAREQGVTLALSDVTGSGKGGRITKADVEKLISGDAE